LLSSIAALLAIQARVRKPLDADAVTNLDRTFAGVFTNGNDLSYTFVPTNKRCIGVKWPIIFAGMQIRMADSSAGQFDEAFARGKLRRLLDWMILPYFKGSSVIRHDCGSLCLWNVRHE
jgi:hypothetical protein